MDDDDANIPALSTPAATGTPPTGGGETVTSMYTDDETPSYTPSPDKEDDATPEPDHHDGYDEEEEYEELLSPQSNQYDPQLGPVTGACNDYYSQAMTCAELGDHVKAINLFNKAAFLSPGEPLIFAARGESYAAVCDHRSAVANYRKALTLPHDREEGINMKARLSSLLDALGIVLVAQRSFADAEQCFVDALEVGPTRRNPLVSLHRAYNFMLQGKEADMNRELAIVGNAMDPMADVLRCYYHVHHESFSEARAALERCLTTDSSNPQVMELERFFDVEFDKFKANVKQDVMDKVESADAEFLSSSLLGDAVAKLTECIKTFPHDPELYTVRASCYCASRTYALAVQDLFECISRSGGHNAAATTQLSRTLVILADELHAAGEFHHAINYYTEALKWDDTLCEAYVGRGDCSRSVERHEAALADYTRLLELSPEHPQAQHRLGALHNEWGVILFNQAKWSLACEEFSKAIAIDDQIVDYHYNRSRCRLMLKQPTLAVRDLVSCRDLGATDPNVVRQINQFCPPKRDAPETAPPRPSVTSTTYCRKPATPPTSVDALRSTNQNLLCEDYNPLIVRQGVKKTHTASGGATHYEAVRSHSSWSGAVAGAKVPNPRVYDPVKEREKDRGKYTHLASQHTAQQQAATSRGAGYRAVWPGRRPSHDPTAVAVSEANLLSVQRKPMSLPMNVKR
eukprot:PhM_4_TR624/c0_g1_i1/m.85417